jgi:hypothetical protein
MTTDNAHLVEYVRHRAKASAYKRVGYESRSNLHRMRAMAHKQHFGTYKDEYVEEAPGKFVNMALVDGPGGGPKSRSQKKTSALETASNLTGSALKAYGLMSVAGAALGSTVASPALAVAGVCLACFDAATQLMKPGCTCEDYD